MTNGEANGIVTVTGKLLGTLPAQFLMLCLVNVVFVGALLWFVNARAASTERLVQPILAACLRGDIKSDVR